ncbi:MAG: DNA-binding response regulator [Acidimicrobiaceae bacterium]|nr:DNA-binding response regulator [Acidimicrobiaceae bacterium]
MTRSIDPFEPSGGGDGGHDLHAAGMKQRILVVDDEPSLLDSVATVLRYEDFEVDVAETGYTGLARAQNEPFDLIVLDVMLPDIDGFEVTRRLRADGVRVPVLFLTARGDVGDLVEGLAAGGDDYVAKPFSLAEVVARTKALLRRAQGEQDDGRLRFADVELDEQTHEVWRAGTPVKLTATEFNVLRMFLLNPRRVLSKDQIIDHVWHYDFGGNQNIVETYVRYVRRKLDALGPPLIHTIRLVGYVLREPEHQP